MILQKRECGGCQTDQKRDEGFAALRVPDLKAALPRLHQVRAGLSRSVHHTTSIELTAGQAPHLFRVDCHFQIRVAARQQLLEFVGPAYRQQSAHSTKKEPNEWGVE